MLIVCQCFSVGALRTTNGVARCYQNIPDSRLLIYPVIVFAGEIPEFLKNPCSDDRESQPPKA